MFDHIEKNNVREDDTHEQNDYEQNDYAACVILGSRLKKTPAEISELSSKNAKSMISRGVHPFIGDSNPTYKRVLDGTHNFLGGEIQRKSNYTRVKNGTHNFLNSSIQSNTQKTRLSNGTHPFLNRELQIKNGLASANKQMRNGTHPSQMIWKCHCGKTGKGQSNFLRWHGDNCKAANRLT